LPERVSVPVQIFVSEPELMMLPERVALKPFVSIVPPWASSEIVREVTRFPVVFSVPPSKSTNCPKPKGVSTASFATERGSPRATMMFGPTKKPKAIGKLPSAIGEPITVFVAVLITDHGAVIAVGNINIFTIRSNVDAQRLIPHRNWCRRPYPSQYQSPKLRCC